MSNDGYNEIRWEVISCDEALVHRLASEAVIDVVIARLLANRGVKTSQEVDAFLKPSLSQLHDPSLLPDMDVGVERIALALKLGEKICVHGDYDVDGVTSAALLVRTLTALGGSVDYLLPHRQRDGYGIKPAAVDAIKARGCDLIVTCDCGITACNTALRANELGMDMIVTDHHEPGAQLPEAIAVINPKRCDSTYPFPELAGVGVAFKFAQGIVRHLGHDTDAFAQRFVDLAALGTVADVVPLIGENRAIVKFGLDAILNSKKIGFGAVLRSANFTGSVLTAYHLAFILAPRINAVGRMDDAHSALKLFLTKDHDEARRLALEMERHNSNRKIEQKRILEEALAQVKLKDLSTTRVLVLSGEGWNGGVVGIVAGRLCETFNRPVIMLRRNPETGIASGSARSRFPFNLIEGLSECADILCGYGGHALAAGLSVIFENIEAFEERINTIAADIIKDEDLLPKIEAEVELEPGKITRQLADSIANLEPFGAGNPEPVFMTRGFIVKQRQRVGDGSHMKLTVQGENCAPINCIAFRMGEYVDRLELGDTVDMCYNIRLNSFNGTESVQLTVNAISC
ncbi:MAG: single-stranded-DNA-specific exonuclease RecJ [Armatimonadetes bacterium]|nr:single-stranded-DNA-specific exonuclease RecJ [Armatimonadota bacterium]